MAITGRNKPKRNYKSEYANYHSKPVQKVNRASRNAARATAKKSGAKVTGKDVAHKKAISKGGKNPGNTKVEVAGANRSFKRNSKGKLVSERSTRERKA